MWRRRSIGCWGRHIHHGLRTGDEPANVAPQQLTETLACEAKIQPGERVLNNTPFECVPQSFAPRPEYEQFRSEFGSGDVLVVS